MQAAAAAPIERLPGEVVARVLFFVDPKTLMMTIPSVSGRFEQGVEVLGLRARLPMGRGSGGRWARRWRKYSFWPWAERGATAMWRGGVVWWPHAGLHGVAARLLGAHGTDPA